MNAEMSGVPVEPEAVILIHGLWLSGWVCSLLGHWLQASGLRVERFSYPSTREDRKSVV